MRGILEMLLWSTRTTVVLLLFGAVVNAATAKSPYFLFLAVPILAVVILVALWLRRRHLRLRMADVILDTEDTSLSLPRPINNLEGDINAAVRRSWILHRSRRNARTTRRRNTDTTIHLVGYPRH